MKKNYAILASALLMSVAGFSQERTGFQPVPEAVLSNLNIEDAGIKTPVPNNKAYGDTLAYFDFNGGLPAGWSIVNNSNNNFQWVWSQDSNVFNSPTWSNGFMMLNGRAYNSSQPYVGMDTYFESGPIPISSTGSVLVKYYERLYFWSTSNTGKIEILVKTNLDTSWTAFDASHALQVNQQIRQFSEVNISEKAAGADTIWVRFYQQEYSHYWWMVDDIAIVEGPSNDMVLDFYKTHYDVYDSRRWQYYKQIPLALADSMFVEGQVINNGGLADTNSMMIYEVTQEVDCYGSPGAGLVHSTFANLPIVPSLDTTYFLFIDPFKPTVKGDYKMNVGIQTAAVDQVPSNNFLTETFTISDTVYAKDDGTSEDVLGPANFIDMGVDGSGMGLTYELPSTQTLTSMSYYVSGDNIHGSSFTARVWKLDTTIAGCNFDEPNWSVRTNNCFSVVAANPNVISVDSTMNNTWVTLPTFPGPVTLNPGWYVVGFTATGFVPDPDPQSNGYDVAFTVGLDRTADRQGPYGGRTIYDYGLFLYNAGKSPAEWGFAGRTPMIRMNFGQLGDSCTTVGIDEETGRNTEFGISPNPNNGQFNLKISTEMAKDYNLTITNMIGQNVYSEQISVNNEELNKNMNFTHLKKGIYFVTLQNDTERQTQKIVIR